jgi:hypothetical protein
VTKTGLVFLHGRREGVLAIGRMLNRTARLAAAADG